MAVTTAIRVLRQHGVAFTEHEYRYEEHGGTATASRELGVDERSVLKTLVMEDEARRPLLVLMRGDREVSTRQLARQAGRKAIHPCDPTTAHRQTGYTVGGISPFGTLKKLPVFVERTVLDLEAVYVNGGRRGLLVRMSPSDLVRVLGATPVDVAVAPSP